MADVSSNDSPGSGRDRKLHQMVVGFVRKVRSPAVVDANPAAHSEESVEEFLSFGLCQGAMLEQPLARQDIFELRQ
jgi:hypothetical protein